MSLPDNYGSMTRDERRAYHVARIEEIHRDIAFIDNVVRPLHKAQYVFMLYCLPLIVSALLIAAVYYMVDRV